MPSRAFQQASIISDTGVLTGVTVTPSQISDQANTSTGYIDLPSGTTAQRPVSTTSGSVRYNTTLATVEVYNGTSWLPVGTVYDAESSSTGFFDLPSGTTAQRPATPTVGMMRYNSTTGFAEVYTQGGWGAFGAQPPSISTISPATFNGESGTLFTITGANFTSDAIVKFISNAGIEYSSLSVVVVDPSQLRATTPRDFTISEGPLDVKVIQASGLFTKLDCIDCGQPPVWQTASGGIGNVTIGTAANITVLATDADVGSSVTYSLQANALPTGLSLSSNGQITGTLSTSYASDTVVEFILRATDNAGNFTDRTFNILAEMPPPTWTTASGKLGASTARTATFSTVTVAATTAYGTITGYSVASGSLPSGLSINSSGAISGTVSAGTTVQTWNFTLRATNSFNKTADRAFNIVVIANTITGVYANYLSGCSDGTGGNRITQFQSVCNGQQTCNFNPLDYGDPQGGSSKSFSIRYTCTAGANNYTCVAAEAGFTRTYSCSN